jgi:ubiquinone/menaquinone biosynthesis C-methylase UbiE
MNKSDKVKDFFNYPDNYLSNDAVIRIRKEIISEMLIGKDFNDIIDIACANAEISKQFFNSGNHLTLVDISEQMLLRAINNIDPGLHSSLSTICGNIDNIFLDQNVYDLIICTGLLAHVEDPAITLSIIATLLKPGGTLILQNTSSSHPYSLVVNITEKFRKKFRKSGYMLNRINDRTIRTLADELGLKLVGEYRSIVSMFVLGRIVGPELKYRIINGIFGSYLNNGFKYLGNDFIYLFEKK